MPSTPFIVLLNIHRLTHGFQMTSRRISQRALAQRLGKSYATIRRAIDYLEAHQLITSVNGQPGYSRDYQLTPLALKGLLINEHTPAHPCAPPCSPVSRGREKRKLVDTNVVNNPGSPADPKKHPTEPIDTNALLDAFRDRHPDAVAAGKRHASRERERARKADSAWSKGDQAK